MVSYRAISGAISVLVMTRFQSFDISSDCVPTTDQLSEWIRELRQCSLGVVPARRKELERISHVKIGQIYHTQRKILLAERSVSAMTAARQVMSTELSFLYSVAAPVRLLSRDLLSFIFLLVVSERRSRHRGGIFAAMTLSHVCASWRETAISCRSLWTDIYVGGFWRSQIVDALVADMTETLLQRSGALPLHVAIHGDASGFTYHPCTLQVLMGSSSRWDSLALFDLGDDHWSKTVLSSKELSIQCVCIRDDEVDTGFDLSSLCFLEKTKKLRLFLYQPDYLITLASLISMDIGSFDQDNVETYQLPSCPLLQELTLRLARTNIGYPVISFPLVHTLTLVAWDLASHDSYTLLGQTILPSLRTLVLRSFTDHYDEGKCRQWNATLSNIITSCHMTITSLTLDGFQGSDETYTDLLRLLPGLEYLALKTPPQGLRTPNRYEGLFEKLSFSGTDGLFRARQTLCTKIIELHLHLAYPLFDEEAVVQMIYSRVQRLPYDAHRNYTYLRELWVTVVGGDGGRRLKSMLQPLTVVDDFGIVIRPT
ncbi:hypothetical protein VKT23_020547 [Stygiomarasmius scandens]|uniref:F-box domain-containing protein n=1 Tax=Marasmiellus scandens TaxID=2682957 RepID=A0ABR1IIV4_9AGAR